MNYFLPRLNQKGIFMDNQLGGIGTRGPGERKLEYDRRRLRDKIAQLNVELEKIKTRRKTQRIQRKKDTLRPLYSVALVGYTNAGKSTLLNKLSSTGTLTAKHGAEVYADDKLFATLDPSTRRIQLESGKELLVTDTVGFINKLPHQLVASFRSTLEEILEASVLLHVIDASNPDLALHEKVVELTLSELGASEIPLIKVYNKTDLVHANQLACLNDGRNSFFISAKTGGGVDKLLDKIDKVLYTQKKTGFISIEYNQPKLTDYVFSNSKVLSKTYKEKYIRLKIEAEKPVWNNIQKRLKNPGGAG